MKNFGFRDLVIVGAMPPDAHPIAEWWASGADDLVRSARITPTLQGALADSHLTVATTSARGRDGVADLDPADLGHLFAGLAPGQTLSLVFGRENHGLTKEELTLTHRTAVIPTSPASPTMNLAQSVAIFCYELACNRGREAGKPRELAAAELVERLHERVQALLAEVGFLHQNNPDRIYDDLRAIAGRAGLDEREATILLGILRQVEWAVRRRIENLELRIEN